LAERFNFQRLVDGIGLHRSGCSLDNQNFLRAQPHYRLSPPFRYLGCGG
jgi:hypothetical protein